MATSWGHLFQEYGNGLMHGNGSGTSAGAQTGAATH